MKIKRGWQRQLAVLLLAVVCVVVTGIFPQLVDASEVSNKEKQLADKLEQVQSLYSKVEVAKASRSQAAAQQESAKKKYQDRKNVFDKANELYTRAVQNTELVSADEIARFAREYQSAKKDMGEAEQTLKAADTELDSCQATLDRLEDERSKATSDIQQLKTDVFDLKMQEPVWAEGYGEAVQSEDKSPLECQALAKDIAKRDAVERGGKALLQSVTKVEMFQLKEDNITVSSYAQIIDQDDTGDWGKVQPVVEGVKVKYVVKIRLKITAAGAPNPFRKETVTITQPVKIEPVTIKPIDEGKKQTNVPNNMVLVEGGTFRMGDTFGDGRSDEKPVHNVTVRSFYMSKYEVTFDEYDAFCNATGRSKPSDSGWGRGQRPVSNVSWHDAVEYCKWRSTLEGLSPAYQGNGNNVACDFTANGYRLPTEAEWEYAAKGGNQSGGYKYSGGDNVNDVAWYDGNAGKMTHGVGQKRANELGIYDMSGNIWEWCWDWRGNYQSGDVDNPLGASAGSFRVDRGGSWCHDARFVRLAFRGNLPPDISRSYNAPAASYVSDLGFRLVRTL